MSLGLAPLIVQILLDAVELINREGASVILVEQFVHKALRHAQRAYVLAKGEVVLEASPRSPLRAVPAVLRQRARSRRMRPVREKRDMKRFRS